MKLIAIIPARGGSKRIHRKNLKVFNGFPLLYWTFKTALDCKFYFDEIYLSSEDDEILNYGNSFGIACIKRPKELSTDEAKTIDVVRHGVNFHEKVKNLKVDLVMTLQPTSPLRKAEDIISVINIAKLIKADSYVTVTKSPVHPIFIKRLSENGYLIPIGEKEPKEGMRRQDIPYETYIRNGSIYLTKRKTLEKNTLFGDDIYPIEVCEKRSVDIDSEFDWMIAENIAKTEK